MSSVCLFTSEGNSSGGSRNGVGKSQHSFWHVWVTSLSLFTFLHWRRQQQPTPVSLPGESQGRGAWWAAVCGVAQGWRWLKRLSSNGSSAVSVYRFLLQRRVSYILCFRCINDWALHHNSWPNVNISLLQSHLCCCWLAKSCPILCNPLDCSSPGSSVMS